MNDVPMGANTDGRKVPKPTHANTDHMKVPMPTPIHKVSFNICTEALF